MDSDVMDVHEAATYLGESVLAIRGKMQRRKIPYGKTVTGRVMFRKRDLDEWRKALEPEPVVTVEEALGA